MSEFDNLKQYYVAAIHCAMAMNCGQQQTKQGNEIFHHFCETLVDGSNYCNQDKWAMKQDLQLLKKALEIEIGSFYRK